MSVFGCHAGCISDLPGWRARADTTRRNQGHTLQRRRKEFDVRLILSIFSQNLVDSARGHGQFGAGFVEKLDFGAGDAYNEGAMNYVAFFHYYSSLTSSYRFPGVKDRNVSNMYILSLHGP